MNLLKKRKHGDSEIFQWKENNRQQNVGYRLKGDKENNNHMDSSMKI